MALTAGMNMNCRILLALAILATLLCQAAGKLIVKPENMDAKVNESTFFNCSTDFVSKAIVWYHGTKLIDTENVTLGTNHERYRIEQDVWNGTYNYNLVIHSVQPGDAGEYTCADDEGFGEKYTVQLVVFDAQSDNSTVNSTIDDEILYIANTSQFSYYPWKKWSPEKLSQMRKIFIPIVVPVVFILLAVALGLKCKDNPDICAPLCDLNYFYCDSECCIKRQSEEEIELFSVQNTEPEIYGLTVLHQELFISRHKSPHIEVYDSTTFDFKRRMRVDGMTNAGNIASCIINRCLYAADLRRQLPAMLRIDPINGNLIKTWTVNGREFGGLISIAGDANVILCIFPGDTLLEYTADGELIRTIKLGLAFSEAIHAVKLNDYRFLVCCRGFQSSIFLLSGKTTAMNLGKTDEFEILKEYHTEPVNSENPLIGPVYMYVDRAGSILVSNFEDKQTVLLSSNLDNPRILISTEHGLKTSLRSCFDESTGKWFVTDGGRIMVCRAKGERIEREIFEVNSL